MFDVTGTVKYPRELLQSPRWYALRTRGRAEKKTHGLLEAAGVESFPAVGHVERAWADRTRTVGMPLFPGYIFVRIPLADIARVLQWPGAVDLVRSRGTPTPVHATEMDAVFRLTQGVSETGELPSDEDPLLDASAGDPVRVISGPFEGLEGVLLEKRGAEHVGVRLAALRQAKAVKVPREALALVGPGGRSRRR